MKNDVFFVLLCAKMEKILTLDTKNRLLELINGARKVLCVGHVNPDGDSMGSTLMVMKWMKRLGKEAHVVMPNRYPDFLDAIPGAEEVVCFDAKPQFAKQIVADSDLIFVCDHNHKDRTRDLAPVLEENKSPRIMIDHHLEPDDFCEVTISRPEMCATCELLCHLMTELGEMDSLPIDEVECLYSGMMTDTGAFTYNSGRAEVYECVSRLIARGLDKDKLYRRLFWTYTPARLRLQGYLLYSKMKVIPEMHAAYMTLTNEERRLLDTKNGDTEGIVNMPLQIKGMKLTCLMAQDTEHPGQYRISLRSVDDFPCNEFSADFFEGGGHRNAAGGKFVGSEEEAIMQFKKAVKAYEHLLK